MQNKSDTLSDRNKVVAVKIELGVGQCLCPTTYISVGLDTEKAWILRISPTL